MDYGGVIREAWTIAWRHRYLWLLGFFAGGAGWGGGNGGQGVQWRANDADAEVATRWVADNPGAVVAGLAALALLLLLLIAIGLIAQGGLSTATADLARGRPSSLGAAWRAGWRLIGRYAGLWLLLLAVIVLVAAIVGGAAAAIVALVALAAAPAGGWLGPALVLLVGLPLAAAGLLAAIVVSIVVAYAQRAIAVEDLGPLAALRAGWLLVRRQPGPSLLAWLIGLGLGLGAGLVAGAAAAVVIALFGGAAALLWLAGGFAAPTVVAIGLGVLALLAVVVVLAALINTFFWTYWTLIYLRLAEGGAPAPAETLGGPVAPARPRHAAP
jgi:hypothetical protein